MTADLDLERLRGEAEDWRILFSSGDATEADAAAFLVWRGKTPHHNEAFIATLRLWESAALALRGVAQPRPYSAAEPAYRPSRAIPRRAIVRGLVAATGAGIVYSAFDPPLQLWSSVQELRADYRTRTGERRVVTASDAVTVELNTRTSINVRNGGNGTRRLELISGEASVQTRGQLDYLVSIAAAGGTLTTRNADLNLRCDGAEVTIACLEGSAIISYRSDRVEIAKGRTASYGRSRIAIVPMEDAKVLTAWRGGQLIFHDTPLRDVVREVNRYRPGKLILLNRELGARTVRAIIYISNIDEIITLIARTYNVTPAQLPGGIVIFA